MSSNNIKIIGAGFGRTGTSSLRDALELLGFAKCYHMRDVYRNKAAKKWLQKANGGDIGWDELLGGCDATVDWPAASFYEELAERNPDAKVLLTVRDPDAWYQSISTTIYPASRDVPRWRRWFSPDTKARFDMLNRIVWDGIFHGRLEDADYAKGIFLKHIEDVKQKLPPERLLVYDVAQGWPALCDFLQIPVPNDVPFPFVNAAKERKTHSH